MSAQTWALPTIAIAAMTTAAVSVISLFRSRQSAALALESLSAGPPPRFQGPSVSAVIPTWNEADYLPNLLTSLSNQSYAPIEAVVADWESCDGTREAAAAAGALVVPVAERGPGPARNEGALAASGDYLLFSDADNILERDLVLKLMLGLRGNGAALAHPFIAHYEDGVRGMYRHLASSFMPSLYTTRCVLVTREAFFEVDGYSNMWREDLDFGRRVRRAFGPGSVLYVRDAVCATSTRRERAISEGRTRETRDAYFPAVRDGISYG